LVFASSSLTSIVEAGVAATAGSEGELATGSGGEAGGLGAASGAGVVVVTTGAAFETSLVVRAGAVFGWLTTAGAAVATTVAAFEDAKVTTFSGRLATIGASGKLVGAGVTIVGTKELAAGVLAGAELSVTTLGSAAEGLRTDSTAVTAGISTANLEVKPLVLAVSCVVTNKKATTSAAINQRSERS
jgi:hypothetical protein